MMKTILVSLIVGVIGFAFQVQAAVSPVAISIFKPVQFPPEDFTITGVRASLLWGQHRNVYGIDLGLVGSVTTGDFVGIAASGVFNKTNGNTTILGLQFAGLANLNYNKTEVYGVQLAGLWNANTATSKVIGLQAAIVGNFTEHTDIYGLQVGIYNRAKEVYGFQIGLVNFATKVHGLQIGLLNFHKEGVFVVSPIINGGF